MSASQTRKIKITVLTVGNQVLTFTVDSYTIEDGFVCFIDAKYNIPKKFPVARTEIDEVRH